jgi:ABC-type multidrug transport system ATPase subunit
VTEHVIRTSGLTKNYGNILAVDRLDLDVRRGEVFGFLGPNGAGKTTTMQMLLGLIRPTSGSADVLGHAPGEPEGLARIGALLETTGLYPYLTGRQNLRVIARYTGGGSLDRVEPILEQVGLSDRADDKVKGYSLGMRQRLGVASALLKDPDLLILDEPTNGLDPQGMAEMRDLLRSLGRGERTVMLSSHLLGEVEQICDRVGVIQRGELVAVSTVSELRGVGGLTVRADPVEKTLAVLHKICGRDGVTTDDGLYHLSVDSSRAPEITRALVHAEVDVFEVRPSERSLEQAFLQLTTQEEE